MIACLDHDELEETLKKLDSLVSVLLAVRNELAESKGYMDEWVFDRLWLGEELYNER